MTKSEIIFVVGVALGSMTVGCSKETTSSANIKTGGIAALMDVTATSSSASLLHVDLKVGGSSSNTYVILDNGDKLTAKAGDESKTLEAVDDGEYEAEFGTAAADTEFTVNLERPEDTSAPNNRGTMPPPFSLTAPDTASRAEDLKITWDAGSDSIELEVDGSCIFNKTIDVPGDSGSYTIDGGTLDPTDKEKAETCDLTLTMTRTRNGTADSAFDGESWFKLHQVRTAKVTSSP